MLNPRRALVAAAFVVLVFFLITRSHSHNPSIPRPDLHVQVHDDDPSRPRDPSAKEDKAQGGSSLPPTLRTHTHDAPQKPMMDMSHMSTYDKLGYQYPYDVTAKFPAYIWQTWKYTPADGEFSFREQEASWTIQHPGFVHEVITDAMAVSILRLFYGSIPDVLEAYHALPLPVLKADFFRYLILFARGGIYSDIDTYAIRSAADWIPAHVPRSTLGLVVGIEADPDRADWADWYSRRIQFCQWTIQAKPGHPVLRAVIDGITNATLGLKRAGGLRDFARRAVVDITGPARWTDALMEYFNDERYFDVRGGEERRIDYRNFTGMRAGKRVGDVLVLPITSFSPGVGQMGAGEPDDPMAFVKHDFEGTWKPESERHMGEQQ